MSTSYRVELVPSARRRLRALPQNVHLRIAARIRELAIEPRRGDIKALAGQPGLLRTRIGDYRIVYRVFDAPRVVEIVCVGHRKDAYRG